MNYVNYRCQAQAQAQIRLQSDPDTDPDTEPDMGTSADPDPDEVSPIGSFTITMTDVLALIQDLSSKYGRHLQAYFASVSWQVMHLPPFGGFHGVWEPLQFDYVVAALVESPTVMMRELHTRIARVHQAWEALLAYMTVGYEPVEAPDPTLNPAAVKAANVFAHVSGVFHSHAPKQKWVIWRFKCFEEAVGRYVDIGERVLTLMMGELEATYAGDHPQRLLGLVVIHHVAGLLQGLKKEWLTGPSLPEASSASVIVVYPQVVL